VFRHSPLSSEMRYAALLRGINVGGNKKVSMAELRDFAATLGLDDPRTLLNSGNLVFASKTAALKLESVLETETKKRFGLETRYFLRAPEEWQSAVEANPFRDEAASDPARLADGEECERASSGDRRPRDHPRRRPARIRDLSRRRR